MGLIGSDLLFGPGTDVVVAAGPQVVLDGYLRPSELLSVRKRDVFPPQPELGWHPKSEGKPRRRGRQRIR